MLKIKSKYVRFLGLVIFVIVLLHVDLGKIFSYFKSIQPIHLISSMAILLTFHISKSIRWQYILKKQSIPYSLSSSYLMYSAGLYAGVITPGRLGDFIKAFYLKKDGHTTGKALASVFLDRILDLFFLFLIAIPSFIWVKQSVDAKINLLGIIIFLALISVIIILVSSKKFAHFWGQIFFRFIPAKYKPLFQNSFNDFYSSLNSFSVLHYLIVVFITVTGWFIYFYLIFFLSEAAGLNIPFLQVVFFFVVSSIAAFIPISVAGIGTRDVTLLYFFPFIGYSKETAVSFSLIILFIYLLTTLYGLIAWIIKPLKW